MAEFIKSGRFVSASPRPLRSSHGLWHSVGIRLRRYLDDWLIQSSSREAVLHDLQVVLDLCREFGIVVNPEKSNFVPSQRVLYLGTVLDSQSFVASPSPDRIARLLSLGEGFLFSIQQPAACWQSLLGTLSSLTHLVPEGRLRMRSLQFQLHRNWDCVEDSTLVPWAPTRRLDPLWWLDEPRLHRGVSVAQVSPDLDFWSDASNVGWGLTWVRRWFPAFGLPTRWAFPSTLGNFSLWREGSSISSLL